MHCVWSIFSTLDGTVFHGGCWNTWNCLHHSLSIFNIFTISERNFFTLFFTKVKVNAYSTDTHVAPWGLKPESFALYGDSTNPTYSTTCVAFKRIVYKIQKTAKQWNLLAEPGELHFVLPNAKSGTSSAVDETPVRELKGWWVHVNKTFPDWSVHDACDGRAASRKHISVIDLNAWQLGNHSDPACLILFPLRTYILQSN